MDKEQLKIKIETEISIMMYEINSKIAHTQSIIDGLSLEIDYMDRQIDILLENINGGRNKEKNEQEYYTMKEKRNKFTDKLVGKRAELMLQQEKKAEKWQEVRKTIYEKYKTEIDAVVKETNNEM